MVLFYSIAHSHMMHWWSHNILLECSFYFSNAFITYFWTRVYNFFCILNTQSVYVIVDQSCTTFVYHCGFLFIIFRFFGCINCIYIPVYIGNVVLQDQQKWWCFEERTWKTRRERADRIKTIVCASGVQLLFIMVLDIRRESRKSWYIRANLRVLHLFMWKILHT